MPINQIIAQGVQPVDVTNTLMRIATMQRADQESERRDNYQNALITRMNRTDMRTRMDRDEAKTKAAELEEMKLLYPLVKAGDETAIKTAIGRISAKNPAAAEALLANPANLAPVMAQVLGIEEPGAIETKNLPGYGTAVLQGGEWKAGRPTPAPDRGPDAPAEQRFAQWYMTLPPEKQAQVDKALAAQRSSGGSDRPQIIQDPWGGDPSVVERGPNGELVRRPVPLAGGSGPTDVRAQAFAEARAAIATGKISKEQAAERLRKAGIDPTGL